MAKITLKNNQTVYCEKDQAEKLYTAMANPQAKDTPVRIFDKMFRVGDIKSIDFKAVNQDLINEHNSKLMEDGQEEAYKKFCTEQRDMSYLPTNSKLDACKSFYQGICKAMRINLEDYSGKIMILMQNNPKRLRFFPNEWCDDRPNLNGIESCFMQIIARSVSEDITLAKYR